GRGSRRRAGRCPTAPRRRRRARRPRRRPRRPRRRGSRGRPGGGRRCPSRRRRSSRAGRAWSRGGYPPRTTREGSRALGGEVDRGLGGGGSAVGRRAEQRVEPLVDQVHRLVGDIRQPAIEFALRLVEALDEVEDAPGNRVRALVATGVELRLRFLGREVLPLDPVLREQVVYPLLELVHQVLDVLDLALAGARGCDVDAEVERGGLDLEARAGLPVGVAALPGQRAKELAQRALTDRSDLHAGFPPALGGMIGVPQREL